MSTNPSALPNSATELALIFTQYRSNPVYQSFQELNSSISMLHPDVLAMLYHFGSQADGLLLELGPYVGGSTVAIAMGLKKQSNPPRLISVEVGGSYDHPNYATSDIVASLHANLAKHGVAERVEVLVGNSRDKPIVNSVETMCAGRGIQFLVIDTDGRIDQDLDLYRKLLFPI